jgi:hypothetical protein
VQSDERLLLTEGKCLSRSGVTTLRDYSTAPVMRAAGRFLVVGWLLAALVVLGMDGRLPEFLAGAMSGSLFVLGLWSLIRQQRAPSRYNRPPLPERYTVADDLQQPITSVVTAAEQDASRIGW